MQEAPVSPSLLSPSNTRLGNAKGRNAVPLDIPFNDVLNEGDSATSLSSRFAASPGAQNLSSLSPRKPIEPLEVRQAQAESRRAEFRAWLLQKAKAKRVVGARFADERFARRSHRLQAKLENAEVKRQEGLDAVRDKAAARGRREEALLRLQERQERRAQRAERLEEGLQAAAGRRLALQEAERERLRQEHELVMTRLALSHERELQEAEQRAQRLQHKQRVAAERRSNSQSQRILSPRKLPPGGGLLPTASVSSPSSGPASEAMGEAEMGLMLASENSQDSMAGAVPISPLLELDLEGGSLDITFSKGIGLASSPRSSTTDVPESSNDDTVMELPNTVFHAGQRRSVPLPLPTLTPAASDAAARILSAGGSAEEALCLGGAGTSRMRAASLGGGSNGSHGSHGGSGQPLPTLLSAFPSTSSVAAGVAGGVIAAAAAGAGAGVMEEEAESCMQLENGIDLGGSSEDEDQRTTHSAQCTTETGGMIGLEDEETAGDATGSHHARYADQDVGIEDQIESFRRNMSSRRLQAFWRTFASRKRTTAALAAAFVATGVTGIQLPSSTSPDRPPRGHAPASGSGAINSTTASSTAAAATTAAASVKAAPSALQRRPSAPPIEIPQYHPPAAPSGPVFIGGLAASSSPRVGSPTHIFEEFATTLRAPATLRTSQALMKRLETRLHARGAASSCAALLRRLFPSAPRDKALERYPPRIFLCAYMILRHPEIVFNANGDREARLTAAASNMIEQFETLIQRVLQPIPTASESSNVEKGGDINAFAGFAASGGCSTSVQGNRTAHGLPLPAHLPPSPLAQGMRYYHAAKAARGSTSATASATAKAATASWPAALAEEAGEDEEFDRRAHPVTSSGRDNGLQLLSPRSQQVVAFKSIGECLVSFDESWLRYLDQFAAWKLEDAAGMEAELVRMAVEMEKSMRRKVRGPQRRPPSSNGAVSPARGPSEDVQAVVEQVAHDHALLRERIIKLSGPSGGTRLDIALEAARAAVANESDVDMAESANTTDVEEAHRSPVRASPVAAAAATAAATAGPASAARPAATAAAPGMRRGFFKSSPAPAAAGSASTSAAQAAATQAAQAQAAALAARPVASAPWASGARGVAPVVSAAAAMPAVLPAQLSAESLGNIQMIWELLHNPAHQLPSDDAMAAWRRAADPDSITNSTETAALDEADAGRLSPNELVQLIKARAKAAADRAFWDDAAARVQEGLARGAVLPAVLPLLAELGGDVADVLRGSQQGAVATTQFNMTALRSALDGSAAGSGDTTTAAVLQRLMMVLQQMATLLVQAGAAAREEDALEAQQAVKAQLTATLTAYLTALATHPAQPAAAATTAVAGAVADPLTPPRAALADAVVRALRLLFAQLRLLKLDAANSRLQVLANSLQGSGAVSYLRTKFALLYHLLPPPVAAAAAAAAAGAASPAPPSEAMELPAAVHVAQCLPRTTAWLRGSRAALGGMSAYLASVGVPLQALITTTAATAPPPAPAAAAVPTTLRAGLRASNAGGPSPAAAPVAPQLVAPLPALDSWRAAVRTGLVALVTGDAPAVSSGQVGGTAANSGLAETLVWDGERLHAAQNAFQQLAVTTASLLLVGQRRAEARMPWPPAERAAALRRLSVVLASPDMRLPDLVTEISSLIGRPPANTTGGANSGASPPTSPSTLAVGSANGGAVTGSNGATEDEEAREASLRASFLAIVNPGSAPFQAISNALAAALVIQLLLGPAAAAVADNGLAGSNGPGVSKSGPGAGAGSMPPLFASPQQQESAAAALPGSASPAGSLPGPAAVIQSVLGRVGAGPLLKDVTALAGQLGHLAAVHEAVHEQVYDAMAQV